ncbi:galactosylgalactosylxylosylprotein 3-beta-glucuronosyltransferase S [Ostrinia furnacalis]|uniref:galactosylgalactosylxylosylprotein 3-beta-glucuronosyltransferase S n=1 Tax=Ostrinia furnacalis TaxID=93504 RepID=UPI00103BB2BE|nr:galactosylgalactosylxylosylprotein 3-beta-glucuronosyltransferase S [Ostrinia furnacalis]
MQQTALRKFFIMALLLCVILLVWTNIGVIGFESFAYKTIPVKNKLCSVNFNDTRPHMAVKSDLKVIYYVTPTYPRPEQIPELTRLSHTLMHVPRIHWIIADDQPLCSEPVLSVLKRSGLPFTHISSPKPYPNRVTNFPRGVSNRRAALTWLANNVKEGILYFGDDDNTIDLQLFEEMRQTKKVSMFPVGLIGAYGVSSPVVKDGKVIAFFDSWSASRMFPVDMAGFAVNMEFLKPSASMPYILGHEEDGFLVSLGLKMEDIEPLADNCSKVLVWHTRTMKYKKPTLKFNYDKIDAKYKNFAHLLNETSYLGMANIDPHSGTKPMILRNRKTFETFAGIL